ncbi:MAG: 3-phosphoshikimate 1-carboxyvinyltransferase [Saprospiraceae bacterium]|nr:3-phosphoshikimate 1-carboxyvinyltransferase [Saprospiraceae bacterium]
MLRLSKPNRSLLGDIALDGSKSISNRALIALALAGTVPTDWLTNLSTSKDTLTLLRLLSQPGDTFDAGDAGTTFRFLTAYLALQPGTQVLTGSARMRERPVGSLVAALRDLGADIEYLEKEGYPPLRIGAMKLAKHTSRPLVRIHAGTSSQFLSALLLIAPYLPHGLQLVPEGNLVSRPYLEMTMRLMRHFGARVSEQGESITVEPGAYQPRPLTVEADWSAASYWYEMAAFADEVELRLKGLFAESWQGDSVLVQMMPSFGVQTVFEAEGIVLKKSGVPPAPSFEWDFVECPDIAQTLAVTCAGLGVQGIFSGLETLFIKETDRVAALRGELTKVGVSFEPLPDGKRFSLKGKATWATVPRFATYHDHRMAMSFAPLAFWGAVEIENPSVVNKSYPAFWEHLAAVGFRLLM